MHTGKEPQAFQLENGQTSLGQDARMFSFLKGRAGAFTVCQIPRLLLSICWKPLAPFGTPVVAVVKSAWARMLANFFRGGFLRILRYRSMPVGLRTASQIPLSTSRPACCLFTLFRLSNRRPSGHRSSRNTSSICPATPGYSVAGLPAVGPIIRPPWAFRPLRDGRIQCWLLCCEGVRLLPEVPHEGGVARRR